VRLFVAGDMGACVCGGVATRTYRLAWSSIVGMTWHHPWAPVTLVGYCPQPTLLFIAQSPCPCVLPRGPCVDKALLRLI
jgi:hypothetical protein